MLKTSGFALRKIDYREYDRIYTVYTSDFGKISLLARGARKIKSKLAPHLEGMNEVRLNFAKGKIFNHLSGASVATLNKGLINDAEKIAFVSDCFYLLDRFIKPEEGDERIYNLMKEVFKVLPLYKGELEGVGERGGSNQTAPNPSLSKEGDSTLQKLRVYFFWRLADLLGYRPQLDECALCGRVGAPLPPFKGEVPEGRRGTGGNTPSAFGISPSKEVERKNLKFNITDNIIICGDCIGEGVFIQDNTLNHLRNIFQFSLAEFLQIDLDNQLIAITEKARQIKLSEL